MYNRIFNRVLHDQVITYLKNNRSIGIITLRNYRMQQSLSFPVSCSMLVIVLRFLQTNISHVTKVMSTAK